MGRITLLLLTSALFTATPTRAQSLAEANGIWYGTLTVPNIPPLRIVIEVYTRPSGVPGAEFISLDEGGNAIIATEISLEGNTLSLSMPRPNLLYTGQVDLEQNRIDGELRTGGASFDLDLERVDTVPNLPRPQLPHPPYPYSEEDVFYDNPEAGVRLAGTLTLPAGTGPFPAVFLVTGSGTQDRDETVAYHRPFRLLADYLSRRGFAVLRTDDRGWGLSTGNSSIATTTDNTGDALAAVTYLRNRSDIDPARVGMVGHSEGGMIASIAAARSPDLAFIVLLAGPGVSGQQVMRRQRTDIWRGNGLPETQVQAMLAWFEDMHFEMLGEGSLANAGTRIRARFANLEPERKTALGWDVNALDQVLAQILSPWFREFLRFEPAPIFAQIHIPVLALNGSKDIQVASDENLAGIKAGLQAAGNNDVTIVELPDLNHFFQHAETGALDEYLNIAETFSPEALHITANWLRIRAGLPPLDDTAVHEEQLTPQHLSLAQNYPNPFNSGTIISYALETPGPTSLRVYNIAGQRIATLVEDERPAGSYYLHWDARDDAGQALASGLYFYTLRTPNGVQTRQMMLLR
ncbi:MAG: pimeloyl-ACP methyl ester carboxylesterase [Planctomycetota bacterium]|jgi:pimeloyl-ACP methyl ester carboxylesterase